MGEDAKEYAYDMEMKIGGMSIFFAVFCVGIVLIAVYVKLFKQFHSPSGSLFNQN